MHPLQTSLLPPDDAMFEFSSSQALPALSPDGRRIVFGARPTKGSVHLYLRRLDEGAAQALPDTEAATFPFWSPDSRWVAFGQGNRLKKVDTQGGPAITLVDNLGGEFRGGSWNRDGEIVFGTNRSRAMLRVNAAGGQVTPVFELNASSDTRPPAPQIDSGVPVQPVYPSFLPDGRHFIYTTRQTGEIPLRVASLDEPGSIGKLVAHTHSSAVYTDGYLLYLRESTLMAQPFDVGRLETTGDPVPLAQGVPTYITPSRGAPVTVSLTGLLVYQVGGGGGFRWRLAERDRHGVALGTIVEGDEGLVEPAVSPDGTRLALVRQGQTTDLWLYNLVRGSSMRFTFGPAARSPEWSSSGDVIFYGAPANGHAELFMKSANGASRERILFRDTQTKITPSVSPDNNWILYTVPASTPTDRDEIWQRPLVGAGNTGAEPHRFIQVAGNATGPRFSPDGHWVAYSSDQSGRFEVYVTAFPGPAEKRQVSSGGGKAPRWRLDERELYYVTGLGQVNAVEITVGNGSLETGRTDTLFDGLSDGQAGPYTSSADGQRFFVVENAAEGVGRPLTIVENWMALLKR
jgi:Tol biopolymer transport system component